MISMPKKWLFVLNKFNRGFVARTCVFFSLVCVRKFADPCFSGYLSSLASSEIPQWCAVLMSSYPAPRSLGVCSQLDLVQLHGRILGSAILPTFGVRECFASLVTLCSSTLSSTTQSRPPSLIAWRIAASSWVAFCIISCRRAPGIKPFPSRRPSGCRFSSAFAQSPPATLWWSRLCSNRFLPCFSTSALPLWPY